MTILNKGQTNRLLGYPLDARLLIINADDFGMCNAVNELPVGLTEWAVHPGLDNTELLAIEPDGNHVRQTDFDFLMSQAAKDIVKEEGIILLDYRVLQVFWRGK